MRIILILATVLTLTWIVEHWLNYCQMNIYLAANPDIVFAEISFPNIETFGYMQTTEMTVEQALDKQLEDFYKEGNSNYAKWLQENK